MENIHIINTRSAIYFDLFKSFGLNSSKLFEMIHKDVDNLCDMLNKKNIDYSSLKKVLCPLDDSKKKEIVLVFEADKYSDFYGRDIFDLFFPLINKKRKHVIKVGDLSYDNNYDKKISILRKKIFLN